LKKKHIILTKHAEERLRERNITLQQVRYTISNPDMTLPAWDKKKRVMKDFGSKCLDVIYRETESVIVLITAVWLNEKERFKNAKDR